MASIPLLILVVAGIILFFLFLYFVPVNLWITATFSGVKVSILNLILMRFRKVPPSVIVNAMITATKAGLSVTIPDLETHYLAGGNDQMIQLAQYEKRLNTNIKIRDMLLNYIQNETKKGNKIQSKLDGRIKITNP